MTDFQDLDIQRTPTPPVGSRVPSRTGTWIALALLVCAAAAAAYIVFFRTPKGPADRVAVAETEVAAAAGPPVAAEAELPPLDEMDAVVRSLLGALSAHPRLAAWLTTDDLVRHFVEVVDAIASGRTPARFLPVLTPARPFTVEERGNTTRIDPLSFARYDALADAFVSIEPARAAEVYTRLRPRLEEAYRERFVGGTFDERFRRAIAVLAETPTPGHEIRLLPHGVGYAFADPELESRPAAQKHLLRTGPRNVRIVTEHLRELEKALARR
jgi:hypothetical protein